MLSRGEGVFEDTTLFTATASLHRGEVAHQPSGRVLALLLVGAQKAELIAGMCEAQFQPGDLPFGEPCAVPSERGEDAPRVLGEGGEPVQLGGAKNRSIWRSFRLTARRVGDGSPAPGDGRAERVCWHIDLAVDGGRRVDSQAFTTMLAFAPAFCAAMMIQSTIATSNA